MDKTAKPPVTPVGPAREAEIRSSVADYAKKVAVWVKGTIEPPVKK